MTTAHWWRINAAELFSGIYSHAGCIRNYNITKKDLKNGIYETTEYLEIFLRNLLLNEKHPLHNRTLHISGIFREAEKPGS